MMNRLRNKSTFFLQKVRYDFRSLSKGVLAQLVERLNGIEEVRGSNPLGSKLRLLALGSERLRLAGQTSLLYRMMFQAEFARRSLPEFQTMGRSRAARLRLGSQTSPKPLIIQPL
jgi:hypothetical protein